MGLYRREMLSFGLLMQYCVCVCYLMRSNQLSL